MSDDQCGTSRKRVNSCWRVVAEVVRVTLVQYRAAEGTMPTAPIVATDERAIGVLAGAWASGLRVPGGLAVISLDGFPGSAYTAPALTVAEQPVRLMASAAGELLLNITTEVPATRAALIRRASCGCRR